MADERRPMDRDLTHGLASHGPKIQTFSATFSFNSGKSGKLMKTYCESVPIGTFGSGRFVQVHTGLLRYTELTMPMRSEEKP